LGGAQALYLDDRIGNFNVGKEADFVVLDWTAGQKASEWQASRMTDKKGPKTVEEAASLLFSIMILGDDRNVDETWILGKRAYQKNPSQSVLQEYRKGA
jgi:guanine deaminase